MDRYDPKNDHYARMGVSDTATHEELRRVYREKARLFHPDGHRAPDLAAREMAAINAAWEVLGDPARRRAYDEQRAAYQLRVLRPEIDRKVAAELDRLRKEQAARVPPPPPVPRAITVRPPDNRPPRLARQKVAAPSRGFLEQLAAEEVKDLRRQGHPWQSALLDLGSRFGDILLKEAIKEAAKPPPRRRKATQRKRR